MQALTRQRAVPRLISLAGAAISRRPRSSLRETLSSSDGAGGGARAWSLFIPVCAAFGAGVGAGVGFTSASTSDPPTEKQDERSGATQGRAGEAGGEQAAPSRNVKPAGSAGGGGMKREIWFGFHRPPAEDGGIKSLYSIGEHLGRGSFGTTFSARDVRNDRDVAIKVLAKSTIDSADSIEDVDREVEIMRDLSGHENVVTFYDALEDEKCVYIAMELCKGGELFDAVKERKGRYTEKEAADTIRQILRVVAHCHLNGIVYCDVKPENFLYLDEGGGLLKAIDFGLSRHFTPLGRALRKPRGTAYYIAPEVMRFEYGPEADLWSVGVIAHLLLTGTVPFCGETDKEILTQVMAGEPVSFQEDVWAKVSVQAKEFVKSLLTRDVGLRLTAVQALQHPWLGEASGEAYIDSAAVSSLIAFSRYGRMRKLALRAVASVVSDSNVIEDLRIQFKAMDIEDNNRISLDELKKVLQSTLWKHTDSEVKELLESIHCYTYGPFRDQSTGATIDYEEFLAATMSIKQIEQAIQDEQHWMTILRKAFQFFDKDQDGLISAEDLKKCLSSDRGDTNALVEECMEEAGVDRAGSISFDGFVALLHIHDPKQHSRYGYVKTPSKKASGAKSVKN